MAKQSSGLTLSDVTVVGRAGVKVFLVFLVLLMVGRTLYTSFVAYWKATHPAPPPPPTMGFGLLPKLPFPSQSSNDMPTRYVLETATGTLPPFGDRAKVFLMPLSSPSLLGDQQAKAKAAAIGYAFAPQVLDSHTYRWSKSSPLEATLELNTQTNFFSIKTNYLSRADLVGGDDLPDGAGSVDQVKQLLSRMQLSNRDMATVAGEITYLKSAGSELVPAVSYSDADFVQVDLDRTPVDGLYQPYSPTGLTGVISALVVGKLTSYDRVVAIENKYQPVDYSQVETYPLRSVQSAWKLLQSGEGYVATKGKSDQATIRNVELGYYEAFEEQPYYQPIYVFTGDEGFLGYVPALDPRVYEE
jgi:hypothetical protein